MNNLTKTYISFHYGCLQMLVRSFQDANMIIFGSLDNSSVIL